MTRVQGKMPQNHCNMLDLFSDQNSEESEALKLEATRPNFIV